MGTLMLSPERRSGCTLMATVGIKGLKLQNAVQTGTRLQSTFLSVGNEDI